MPRIPVWLDCDTGHDDAYALLLACFHPGIQLLGVSTVFGNAPADRTHNNTRAVLSAIGRPDVRVVRGETGPLNGGEATFATSFHGESGLDGVPLLPQVQTVGREESHTAVEEMTNAILAQPYGKAWIVATGPMTNVAKALDRTPALKAHLGGISIMGGAIGGGFTNAKMGSVKGEGVRFGNWSPFAEFNIFCDPLAADMLFEDDIIASKLTMIPLDLTHQCLATPGIRGSLFREHDKERSFIREMMQQIMMFFAQAYSDVFQITEGPPLHDPLAVFALVCPEHFEDRGGERWKIRVVQEGEKVGQTMLVERRDIGVRIPRSLDLASFWSAIENALASAEQMSKAY